MTDSVAIGDVALEQLRRRRSAKWTWYADDVLPAFVAEMDFPLAPSVRDALRDAVDRDDVGYASTDAARLGHAFAGFAERQWEWGVDPDLVTPLNDVVSGLYELVRVLTEPGDGVIVTPPVYHPFFDVIADTGRTLVEAPLRDGRELDPDAVEAAFADGARALILCNPHNPVGQVLDRATLERLAEIAAANDGWVLSDEIHAPLVYGDDGAAHVPFTSVSEAAAARGFVLMSASKAFNLAGLKCAVLVTAEGPARERVAALPQIAAHCGHLGVIGSVAAFREGDDWLAELVETLRGNRRLVADALTEVLPEVGYAPPEAGYLAWLDCRELDLGEDPAEGFLERGRVALSSGPIFGRQGAGFARLNFATAPDLIREAVRRMASAVGR